ncbi:hypothetical protein [Gelidibacter pelagius]|uniref:Uncharacterized protein n=1 Tax=Gelidibacter pelagius TaxID=2819985 RepID=A0ABS3SSU7_9FLAO|nr:hypothetical protein [Gelidibacter pelagius]MBO3098792.1 hypothetical protein [Gelidibacter pelagius]
MKKKLHIEIGSDLKTINGIGFFMTFFGQIAFFVTGILLWSNNYFPLKEKEISFVGLTNSDFYLIFILSLLVTIIGFILKNLCKYETVDLEIYDNRIVFRTEQNRVELLNEKIYKLIPKTNSWNGKKRLNIKMFDLSIYKSQMNKATYSELTDLYANKFI